MGDKQKIKAAIKLVKKAARLLEDAEEMVGNIEGASDSLADAYTSSTSAVAELDDALGFVDEDQEDNPAATSARKLKRELLR